MTLALVGTDTEVGKTTVAALVMARYGPSLGTAYWKPVASGADDGRDVTTVAELSGAAVLDEEYLLRAPLSPHAAAALEGRSIDLARLTRALAHHRATHRDALLLEGVGGLLVPLTTTGVTWLDWHAAEGLAALLVARSTLGTINHTLLSLEALRARRVPVVGVVLNGPPNAGNRDAIERFGAVPVLAEVPPLNPLTPATVAAAAAHFDTAGALRPYLAPLSVPST